MIVCIVGVKLPRVLSRLGAAPSWSPGAARQHPREFDTNILTPTIDIFFHVNLNKLFNNESRRSCAEMTLLDGPVYNINKGRYKGTCHLQGHVSKSDELSYRKISRSLEAARLTVWIIVLFWNLTGTSAGVLPMRLSNFRAITKF